jgi:nucleoside-diphosphate-sugar epimerase
MKIAVIGTGLIGSQVVSDLTMAGHDVFTLDELGRITLEATGDHRHVVTDETAGLFAAVRGDVLTAPADAHLASTHYRDWLLAR